jgi:hypothetical protein
MIAILHAGLHNLTLHGVLDIVTYWVFFWNAVYVICPPREFFNSPKYDLFLRIVSYYGGMNVRKITTQMYSVVNGKEDAPKP